jgi:hypothetical protein
MPQCISQDTKNNPLTPVPTAASAGIGTPAPSTLSDQFGTNPVTRRLAVYKAAKAVRHSPAFVMKFINEGLLKAYRRGGPVNKPWLEVDLSELLAVIDQETLYVPPAMVGRKMPAPRVKKHELHPLAAAL